MDYRGLKWLKFNFIIHPTELVEIYRNLNNSVYFELTSKEYKNIDETLFFNQYEKYYQKIISGQEWIKENDWNLEIYTSITNNPNLIEKEPLINVTTFCLTVDSKDRFSVALYDLGISNLGIQINYPKEIYSFDSKKIFNTEHFYNFKLFTEIIETIKKKGRKAKVKRKNKVLRPNFWLTEKVIDDINHNYNIKNNLIEVI